MDSLYISFYDVLFIVSFIKRFLALMFFFFCCKMQFVILIVIFSFDCSASDGYKLFSYSLEKENHVFVAALLYIPSLKRVICALSNGRLFLLNSEVIPSTPSAAEGTFVMSELGSKNVIYCVCATYKTNEK